MKFLSVILFCCLAACCASVALSAHSLATTDGAEPSPQERMRAEAAYRQGMEFFEQAIWDGAIDRLFRAVSLVPEPRYYTMLGRAQHADGRTELAFFSYANALRRVTDDHEDYEGLLTLVVSTGLDLGYFDEVRPWLEPLAEVNPQLADTAWTRLWLETGHRALEGRRYSEAFRAFEEATKTTTDHRAAHAGQISALKGLAEVLQRAGRYERRLDVLLRLHGIVENRETAEAVFHAFHDAGRPAARRSVVTSLSERFGPFSRDTSP